MNLPDQKYCPRCRISFECKADNIQECQCSAISLTEEEKAFIGKQYSDCLCRNCLQELQQQIQKTMEEGKF